MTAKLSPFQQALREVAWEWFLTERYITRGCQYGDGVDNSFESLDPSAEPSWNCSPTAFPVALSGPTRTL